MEQKKDPRRCFERAGFSFEIYDRPECFFDRKMWFVDCAGRILEAIRGGGDELQMGVIIKEEALMEF